MSDKSHSDQVDDPRREIFKQQTSESFAALGRYIQEFELMVDCIRTQCTSFLGGSVRSQIVFSHHAFTAQPLFDLYRALILNELSNNPAKILPKDQILARDLLNDLTAYIQNSVKVRNDIVHGTWRIGWASVDQTDFRDIAVHKLKLVKDGYKIVKPVSSASDLDKEIEKIKHIHRLLSKLNGCIAMPLCIDINMPPASKIYFMIRLRKLGQYYCQLRDINREFLAEAKF